VKAQVQQTATDTARELADEVLACETRAEVQAVLDGR
jgi:phosphoenolpyruvate-protein kinase (PTS system EI component)